MTTTFFSFNSRENADKFIGALFDHGATNEDISAIARNSGATLDASEIEKHASHGITTTTATDFGKGAMLGTGVGLTLGVAAGIASLVIPGIGLVLGGGALASAIAGAASATAGGALAGGIAGYMRDMGVEGEVPDEFDRDYTEDNVIVGVNTRSDGISLYDLEALAEKYHAIRTTLNRQTAAAVPVDLETVKERVVDPVTGDLAETTVEVRKPEGASQVETIPVNPVVPIPGTNVVQPMTPREPVANAADPESLARVEEVRTRPAFPTTNTRLIETRVVTDESGTPVETQTTSTPVEAAQGDVFVEKRVVEEKIDGRVEKRVEVNPVTGIVEREIVVDPEGEEPSDNFYKA